jgi:cytochrome c6
MQPDPVLVQSIKAGRNAMPGFQGLLRDRDILDVIAYARTLR